MPVVKINIEEFLELSARHFLIDVRSPSEYSHAHIPGSYNLPLFSDEERVKVGTVYKQQNRENAIKLGLDFFSPKMRNMVEEIEARLQQNIQAKQSLNGNGKDTFQRTLMIYCWRGGMRSAAIAWLMDLYGFRVFTLSGGYKSFRNYALETFRYPFKFNILGGYTGSGKTETLKNLKNSGETIVDLEDLAKHKGSAFGNIGMPQQPTQEMFENRLSLELVKARATAEMNGEERRIWLEDESQRIGLVNIPHELWATMRKSPLFFLDIPFEQRLDHILKEYGKLDPEKVISAIERISRRLGNLESRHAVSLFSEGKTRESFRILLTYYDRWYLKGLHNRESLNSLLHTVKSESVSPLNAQKLMPHPEHHEKL